MRLYEDGLLYIIRDQSLNSPKWCVKPQFYHTTTVLWHYLSVSVRIILVPPYNHSDSTFGLLNQRRITEYEGRLHSFFTEARQISWACEHDYCYEIGEDCKSKIGLACLRLLIYQLHMATSIIPQIVYWFHATRTPAYLLALDTIPFSTILHEDKFRATGWPYDYSILDV